MGNENDGVSVMRDSSLLQRQPIMRRDDPPRSDDRTVYYISGMELLSGLLGLLLLMSAAIMGGSVVMVAMGAMGWL